MNWQKMIDRIDAARIQWWLYSLLCGLVAVVAMGLTILMVFVLFDLILQISTALRVGMFWLWGAVSIVMLTWAIYRSYRHQRTRQAVARCVEAAYPEVGNDLIILVQLAESDGGGSEAFRQAALAETSFRTMYTPIERVATRYTRRSRWWWALHSPRDLIESSAILAVVIGLFLTLSALSPRWASSLNRVIKPWNERQQITFLDREVSDHGRRV